MTGPLWIQMLCQYQWGREIGTQRVDQNGKGRDAAGGRSDDHQVMIQTRRSGLPGGSLLLIVLCFRVFVSRQGLQTPIVLKEVGAIFFNYELVAAPRQLEKVLRKPGAKRALCFDSTW